MNTFTKVGIGIGATTSLGGVAYGMYSALRTRTYSELLSDTLLNTKDQENKDNWTSRLDKLTKVNADTLIDSLKAVKTKSNPTWEDLRNWCKNNIANKNKGEEDKEFQNIQTFCTYSIKEKLKNPIKDIDGSNNYAAWSWGYKALKNIKLTDLDEKLKLAKNKQENEGSKEVKEWCDKAFENPYKGENNQEFKNASKVCVSSLL